MEEKIRKAIKELSEPHPLQLFVDDELSFYKKYFNHFSANVIREKKILVFENPNRMKVTFEFDVQGLKKSDNPLFVFLPNTRKNWLKIMWEGMRLSVASVTEVKNAVWEVVKDDVASIAQSLSENNPMEFWNDKIWGTDEHLPCFISGNIIEGDGQLVVEFFDSFEKYQHTCGLFDERTYIYEYALDAGKSHWIYVKAPEKFQIALTTEDKRAKPIKGNDPEIKAFRIHQNEEANPIKLNIEVKVPPTLKWWYRMVVFLSIAFIVSFGIIGYKSIGKGPSMTPAFAQVGISLVAAIIATRGWIMNDETVLKRVSNIMTALAIIIIALIVAVYSMAGLK